MINTDDVFGKIKEMSMRVANPRPFIPLSAITSELQLMPEQLLHSIRELKKQRLIQYDTPTIYAPAYIKLTLLGFTVIR